MQELEEFDLLNAQQDEKMQDEADTIEHKPIHNNSSFSLQNGNIICNNELDSSNGHSFAKDFNITHDSKLNEAFVDKDVSYTDSFNNMFNKNNKKNSLFLNLGSNSNLILSEAFDEGSKSNYYKIILILVNYNLNSGISTKPNTNKNGNINKNQNNNIFINGTFDSGDWLTDKRLNVE